MSSWALNNVTAPDAYADGAVLQNLPFPSRINLDVVNAGIYWQLQQAASPTPLASTGTWQTEVFMAPGSRSIYRPGVRGIRVRAAIPAAQLPAGGLQAQVTVEAVL